MKRVLCVLLLLCLLPVCAYATEYGLVIAMFESFMQEYNCTVFPNNYYTVTNNDGTEQRHFFITDNVKVVIVTDGKNVDTLTVNCFDEKETLDFFVACLAGLSAFDVASSSAAQVLFFDFINAKNGDNTPHVYGNSVYSSMKYYPEKNMYMLYITKVDE